MSWTNNFTQSNTFKVKNTEEVEELLNTFGIDTYLEDGTLSFSYTSEGYFDDSAEVVLSIKPVESDEDFEPKNFLGVISEYTSDSVDIDEQKEKYNLTDEDIKVIPITEYLQDQLLDETQYITITSIGYTERMNGCCSDPYGDVIVIGKNGIKSECLQTITKDLIKQVSKGI